MLRDQGDILTLTPNISQGCINQNTSDYDTEVAKLNSEIDDQLKTVGFNEFV